MKKINLPIRFCLICKKPIIRVTPQKGISPKQYINAKFCSAKCRGLNQSQTFVGKKGTNWRGGKSKCIDCNKELSYRYSYRKNSRCKSCWLKFHRGENHCRWKGGFDNLLPNCKICGEKTHDNNSKICRKCYRGANSSAWKGGVSELTAQIRTLSQYKLWRISIFTRDNYTCQECGGISKYKNTLRSHHIKGFTLILKENNIKTIQQTIDCKELWAINNGITLCKKCHKLTDNYGWKSYNNYQSIPTI